jgi:hypothetical protein
MTKKFILLSVINPEWCRRMARVEDVGFYPKLFLKRKCEICGEKLKLDLYKYKDMFFCEKCIQKRADMQEIPALKKSTRVVADYINSTHLGSLFSAKKTYIRILDILSVEGAAYDHSIVRFNNNTYFAENDCIRVSERKSQIMHELGEIFIPQKIDKE